MLPESSVCAPSLGCCLQSVVFRATATVVRAIDEHQNEGKAEEDKHISVRTIRPLRAVLVCMPRRRC